MKKTEKEHIIELKKGSYSAFDFLFSVYKKRLYAFAFGYLKIPEDAEEIVQEVFVKVWQHRAELDETRSFNSYLFTISKNTILNYFRKKSNEQAYIEYLIKHTDLEYNKTEEDIQYNDIHKYSQKVIDQLPPRQKEIYRLSREEGISNEEIARRLNISRKTVENHVSLAMKFIREHLEDGKLLTLLYISLFL